MVTRVLVTGMGVVSPVGVGRDAFWSALVEGRSGAGPVELFDTSSIGRSICAQVKDFRPEDHLRPEEVRRAGRCSQMALAGARMAVADARLPLDGGSRMAVVLGTTMGEAGIAERIDTARLRGGPGAIERRDVLSYAPYLLSHFVARALGAKAMVLTLPAACAAGNYAIGFASDLIRAGRADVVITGAAEMLQAVEYAGFARLGALAPERCQPFDLNRKGLLLGEGAGILVLESEAHAVRRGATALAEVGGYGLACDAYHITRPHPDGTGNARAMREAITRSGLTPDDVDFVNAHGTGTSANDSVESKVVNEIFGARRIPVTSVKSVIGHCMGASSALEAVSCIETLLTGILPPTMNYETPDPACDVNVVANAPQRADVRVVLNNALAFGGYDAVMCFAALGRLPEVRA
jgi:3-oxoacyl-[acyl-carrier-protein] synthase II